jgi:hypothetical protein
MFALSLTSCQWKQAWKSEIFSSTTTQQQLLLLLLLWLWRMHKISTYAIFVTWCSDVDAEQKESVHRSSLLGTRS